MRDSSGEPGPRGENSRVWDCGIMYTIILSSYQKSLANENIPMMFRAIILLVTLLSHTVPTTGNDGNAMNEPEKSAFFVYVGLEYIYTVEIVKPGIPLLNFVSMSDRKETLRAKNVRLKVGNRYEVVGQFVIEGDRYQEPMSVSSISMHPRSSFGFRLQGDFENSEEVSGVEITQGDALFRLVPLSKFDFETLVRRINRLNLDSPDFREDYRVLGLDLLDGRSPLPR